MFKSIEWKPADAPKILLGKTPFITYTIISPSAGKTDFTLTWYEDGSFKHRFVPSLAAAKRYANQSYKRKCIQTLRWSLE